MRPAPLFRALVVVGLAALALVGVPNPISVPTLHAFQPYYPYPCPFVSGGKDFSGDGFEELFARWNPPTGFWSTVGSSPGVTGIWGTYGDIPVPGDYNGDLQADFAVWRPSNGTWYVKCSTTTACPDGVMTFEWGTAGDIPVPDDYNNDLRTDFAVWRPTTGYWYIRSGANPSIDLTPAGGVQWGAYGDCPVPGRLQLPGIGALDLNVWRPSSGVWYYGKQLNGGGGSALAFGAFGDIPFPIDMDGGGDSEFVVWRPSTGVWYVLDPPMAVPFGQAGDIPIPLSSRGGLASNLAVFSVYRPGNRMFYTCSGPLPTSCFPDDTKSWGPFGVTGDLPLAGRYR